MDELYGVLNLLGENMAFVIDDRMVTQFAAWMIFYAGVLLLKRSDSLGGILMGVGISLLIDLG